jgi:hypothetical protein
MDIQQIAQLALRSKHSNEVDDLDLPITPAPKRQRYSSTPWTERGYSSEEPDQFQVDQQLQENQQRQPSLLPSIERIRSSATPVWTSSPESSNTPIWTLPSPSPSTTPRFSQTSSPSQTPNPAYRDGGDRIYSQDDQIDVLRIAYKYAELYTHEKVGVFWERVAKEYARKKTGDLNEPTKWHKSLSRLVNNWIKERREKRLVEHSGEDEDETRWTQQIDKWIEVVDARDELDKRRKQAISDVNTEGSAAREWLTDQFKTYVNKDKMADGVIFDEDRRREARRVQKRQRCASPVDADSNYQANMDQLFDILAADSSKGSNNDRNNEEVLEVMGLRMDKVEGELRGLTDKMDVLIALVTQQNRAS